MKKNVGFLDRLLRLIVGTALLSIAVIAGKSWGYVGIIPILTCILGSCPLYQIFGISSQCKSCVDNGGDAA